MSTSYKIVLINHKYIDPLTCFGNFLDLTLSLQPALPTDKKTQNLDTLQQGRIKDIFI